MFYGQEMLISSPIPKPMDYPLPAIRDCLFIVFRATHGGRFLRPNPPPCIWWAFVNAPVILHITAFTKTLYWTL